MPKKGKRKVTKKTKPTKRTEKIKRVHRKPQKSKKDRTKHREDTEKPQKDEVKRVTRRTVEQTSEHADRKHSSHPYEHLVSPSPRSTTADNGKSPNTIAGYLKQKLREMDAKQGIQNPGKRKEPLRASDDQRLKYPIKGVTREENPSSVTKKEIHSKKESVKIKEIFSTKDVSGEPSPTRSVNDLVLTRSVRSQVDLIDGATSRKRLSFRDEESGIRKSSMGSSKIFTEPKKSSVGNKSEVIDQENINTRSPVGFSRSMSAQKVTGNDFLGQKSGHANLGRRPSRVSKKDLTDSASSRKSSQRSDMSTPSVSRRVSRSTSSASGKQELTKTDSRQKKKSRKVEKSSSTKIAKYKAKYSARRSQSLVSTRNSAPSTSTAKENSFIGLEDSINILFKDVTLVGKGSFGVVYRAKLHDGKTDVAIKRVLLDKKRKRREVDILKQLEHPNIVKLLHFFYSIVESTDEKEKQVFVNLVMEYIPETLHSVVHSFKSNEQAMPMLLIKIYMYQVFRGLAYMHSYGFCHRDIKPKNVLIDPTTDIAKLCDFGCAKQLTLQKGNMTVCSRIYRAPEILLRARYYTNSIDVWSAGCVLAKLLLGKHIFAGKNETAQLAEIYKLLGSPTLAELKKINSSIQEISLPKMKPRSLYRVFPKSTPENALDLIRKLFLYDPSERLKPLQACAQAFFDELRDPNTRRLNDQPLPPLFNFTLHELGIEPTLNRILVPPYVRNSEQNRLAQPQSGSLLHKT